MIFLVISKKGKRIIERPSWESAASWAELWYDGDFYAIVLLDNGEDGNDD